MSKIYLGNNEVFSGSEATISAQSRNSIVNKDDGLFSPEIIKVTSTEKEVARTVSYQRRVETYEYFIWNTGIKSTKLEKLF